MKKLFSTILVLSLLLSGNAYSAEPIVFPFTIDEQVQTAKDNEDVVQIQSNELKSDDYWNSPLTKLDYYLMQIKNGANEASKDMERVHSDGSSMLGQYFENIKIQKKFWSTFGKYEKSTVSNKVYYDETKGKIIIHFDIKAGKAKEPLKKICQNVFKNEIDRSWYIPNQKITAASPNSQLLKQLYRGGSYKDYSKQIEKVANNIVYILSVNSEVLKSIDNRAKDFFNMTCYKLKPNDEIIYRKWSFAMKNK
jgi:hypothetical protein